MSKSFFKSSALSPVFVLCAVSALALAASSCGSRSGKVAAPAPSDSTPPQNTGLDTNQRSNNGQPLSESDSLALGKVDLSVLDEYAFGNGDSRSVDSRDASRSTDPEAQYMRSANEAEKRRAGQMWLRSAKKDREITDAFIERIGNEKSHRKTRERIYDLAKRVHQRKHDVSKSSSRNRAAKVHSDLKEIFEETLRKTVGEPKSCTDITAERKARGLVQGRDFVLRCKISQETSYELNYAAYEGIKFNEPVAGIEIAHVEVSPSEYSIRNLKSELEVVMVSSRAQIFRGANKRAAICRTLVSYVRSVLRACDNPGQSGPNVDTDPCSNNGGNSGPCVTEVPVEGQVFVGDCDEDPCSDRSNSRWVSSRSVISVSKGGEQPRAKIEPSVPSTPGTRVKDPAPVVDRCAPRTNPDGTPSAIVDNPEDC